MFRISCIHSAPEIWEIINKKQFCKTTGGKITLHIVDSKSQDFITSTSLKALKGPSKEGEAFSMAFPINMHPVPILILFFFCLASHLYPTLCICKPNWTLTHSHHSCSIILSGFAPFLQNAGCFISTQLHILHIPQDPTLRLSCPESLFPFVIFLSFITFYLWKCFTPCLHQPWL